MPVPRLTAIVLHVTHVASSAAFYRDCLGAVSLFDYGDTDTFLALRLSDVEIHLHAAQAATEQLASARRRSSLAGSQSPALGHD